MVGPRDHLRSLYADGDGSILFLPLSWHSAIVCRCPYHAIMDIEWEPCPIGLGEKWNEAGINEGFVLRFFGILLAQSLFVGMGAEGNGRSDCIR